jgi:uncharacterized protein YecE (DUF72 family)
MEVFIGCSGFSYKEWKNLFYPENIPARKQLKYYSAVRYMRSLKRKCTETEILF